MKKLVMLAAACAVAAPAFAQNVATVDGTPITQQAVDQFVQLLVNQGATDSPQLREQVKQELINRQIFVQAAERSGVAKKPEVMTEIELTRQGILVRALMTDFLEKHPVTDKQVTEHYQKLKKEQGNRQEYKVRHILVEDEKTANDLIAQLNGKKAKFEDLATKNSKDPGSAAVTKLKKGDVTAKPVQTQFGWHVIQLEDARPVEFPPLEQVRPQIEEMLRQEAVANYQQSLRSKAKVQ